MVLSGKVRRAGIFVFFDRDGIVDRYVKYLLNDLRKNLDYLVIICNGKITVDGREELQLLCDEFYARENIGLDAGAFKDGFLKIFGWEKLNKFDEIVLVNDTFYGPVFPFFEIFREMNQRDVDFWGLTEHYESFGSSGLGENGVYPSHIQTYFVAIRKPMFSSREFHEYWEKMETYDSFDKVVGNHEVIFTKHFRDLGFKGIAYCDLQDMKEENCQNINYYAFLPGVLVRERRFCAIKRKNFVLEQSEVLVHGGGEELRAAMDYVQFHTDYDVSMIWENLLRLYEMPQLKQALHLNYVLPKSSFVPTAELKKAIIVVGCVHESLFEEVITWIKPFIEIMPVRLLTDTEEKANKLRKIACRAEIFVSASMDWWNYSGDHEYVCYVHDAVAEYHTTRVTGRSYRYQLFENLLSTVGYVQNVLQLFSDYPQVGVLAPPLPYHSTYYRFFGKTWGTFLDEANQISLQLGLHHLPGTGAYQPLMIDYSGWYRKDILQKLQSIGAYHQEAVCRIVPLVAQDMGYYSGWVMTTDYASLEVSNLQYMAERLSQLWHTTVPAERFAEVLAVARMMQNGAQKVSLKIVLKMWLKNILPAKVYYWLKKIYSYFK